MKFDKRKLPNLDDVVIEALNLFIEEKSPKLHIKFKRPLVVGSGNAAVTGKIIFSDRDAVFADEGTYKQKLKTHKVDGAVLVSASGGKHAPLIAKELKKRKIRTVLITNNKNALAARFTDKIYVFPKNIEPYTYNTSTYLGMILAKTKESPKDIFRNINRIKKRIPRLKKYDSYFFILPEELDPVREMFLTKFDELFGPVISGRVFTVEQTKHAKTVTSSNKELFVGLGYDNKLFGKNRLNIPLIRTGYGTAIAVGYYLIGHIQKQNKPYFKDNILSYTEFASKIFGHKIEPIVK